MNELIQQQWGPEEIREFRRRLLSWFGRHKRALPWRSDPAPYRVWIAEIMLQQTRVQTVLSYYQPFLERFPDVQDLAAASEAEVLRFWAGLGYYRRARNLHHAARLIVTEFGGEFPHALEQIRRLPGVGRYTAAAIYSIAFGAPEPVVDGNVRRVVSRLLGCVNASEDFYWQQARSWLAVDHASSFNQAFMELGALICKPLFPLCSKCPVRPLCRTANEGPLPRRAARKERAREMVNLVVLALECRGKIALVRRSGPGFIPGVWGLPVGIVSEASTPDSASRGLARRLLAFPPALSRAGTIRHTITFRRIVAHVYRGAVEPVRSSASGGHRCTWVPLHGVPALLTSSLFLKVVKSMGNPVPPRQWQKERR